LFNKLFSESDTNNNNNNKDAKQLVKEKSEDCVGEGDGVPSWLLVQVDCCDGKGDAEQETEEYKNSYAYYKKMRKQK
jgi:hypothetical protein